MNQTEIEFRAAGGGQSQVEKLRDYFLARPGVWIDMPELALVITPTGIGAAVHSRVNDCRLKHGMNVENEVRRVDGQSQSRYRYVPRPHTLQT
jgi:hypothetical protein